MDQACDLVQLPWILRKAAAFFNTLLVSTLQETHAFGASRESELNVS